MIKYFHELTREEVKELTKKKITREEYTECYPQPKWCNYPEATLGTMGCWSLMSFMVTGEEYCKGCDCYSSGYTK